MNTGFFNNNKSLAVSLALVDAIAGASSAFRDTKGGIIVKSIAAAAALTMGLARVAQIKKVKPKTQSVSVDSSGSSVSSVSSDMARAEDDKRKEGISLVDAGSSFAALFPDRTVNNTTIINVENKIDDEGMAIRVREGNNSISSRNIVEVNNE